MKTIICFLSLMVVLSLAWAIPAAAADPVSMSVVSDANVKITGVYNKSYGTDFYVDLSGAPMNAVLAAEPKPYATQYSVGAVDSAWDLGTDGYFQDTNPGAEWIWETVLAENPATAYDPGSSLYDSNASSNGRVVKFEKSFFLPGVAEEAVLHITADNCYEVWINGNLVGRSATAKA